MNMITQIVSIRFLIRPKAIKEAFDNQIHTDLAFQIYMDITFWFLAESGEIPPSYFDLFNTILVNS